MMLRSSKRARALAFLGLWTGLGLPLAAYIGPGAGFAFLSSFLVLFLTFLLAVFSILAWPFRFLFRLLKGKRAYKAGSVEKVVILGLDGLEPTLAEKYMTEGKCPNLAAVRKEGCYARLRTTVPSISPVAWSSFMTGVEPSKHNIFDFLSRDPRTYLPDLSSARIGKPRRILSFGKYNIPLSKPEIKGLRKSVPFWKTLAENGIFSTVLRVPITFPPEKFAGHCLSGMCAPDLKGSQGTFSFYTSDLEKIQRRESGLTIPVAVEGNRIETFISGPENTLLKKGGEVSLPLHISLDPERGEALLEVSGQRFKLKKDVFSPWVRLTFRPGLGFKIKSIARFYISRISPHFEMYLTPLNIDPAKPALPISQPFIYSVYLAKLLGSFITLGEANDTWALNEGALSESAFLDLTYSNHREWEAMLSNALEKTRRGLVVCVFETTDSIQHMFWRYLDEHHPALKSAASSLNSRVIEDLYVNMDRLVGKVRQSLNGKSVLFVMSDHGFKSFRRGVNLNTWLCLNGYLHLSEGKSGSGEWFRDVDWGKTKAYGLGLGGLYLNLIGREAHGIVAPGEEAKALKGELIAKLSGLRDDEMDCTAINVVYDREMIYAGPYRENAPDLVVGYAEGYRVSWDSVTGKVGRVPFEDNPKSWSGDHCIDPSLVPGVLFSTRALQASDPSIMDLAPTVLDLFGVRAPAYMDGRSLVRPASAAAAVKGEPR